MFSECSAGGYAAYTCGDARFLLFDAAAGVRVASGEPSVGVTVAVDPAGRVSWTRGGAGVPPGARAAVQLYPSLLEDGEVTASGAGEGAEVTWRAALGQLNDGRLAFAVMRAAMPAFALALRRAGFRWAGYTDGGGSARVATRAGAWGSSEDRRVPAWLVARAPAPAPPKPSALETLAPALALGVLAYGAARYLYRRGS
jgi:hypothetical protein